MLSELGGAMLERSERKRTIVLTGAGISSQAGIPTFEEKPEYRDILDLEYFNQNFEDFWKKVIQFQKFVEGKNPTIAHNLLANKMDWPIVTMNIDSLHEKAGTQNLIEVHGNLKTVSCTKCNQKYPFAKVNDGLYCSKCGGRLRPDIALYGDQNIPGYKLAMQEMALCSTVLIVGTSFKTNFADQFYDAAKALSKEIIIFNQNVDEELTEYLLDIETRF